MTEIQGAAAGPAARIDLFTCYSRRDRKYVRSLVEALRAENLSIWVDLEAIPPADPDWPGTVDAAIIGAPAFLFVVSPDSLASEQCRRELGIALDHRKQLIVVAHRRSRAESDLEAVRRSNWIPGVAGDIQTTIARILIAYSTDLAWKRYSADLDLAATRWRDRDRDSSYLLRGNQLTQAESEVETHAAGEPPPNELQREFISASRYLAREAERREGDENRVAIATDWLDRDATTAALVLLEVEDPDRTPFAIERMNEVLRRAVLEFELTIDSGLSSLAFSPDSRLIAAGSWGSRSATVWPADGRGAPVSLADGSQVDSVAFSADSRLVATCGNGGTIKVWRADGRGRPIVIHGAGDAIAFSPDGKALAAVWADGRAMIHKGRRLADQVELSPDHVFDYEPDKDGWQTQPPWLNRREKAPTAPGYTYYGEPGWYRYRRRLPGFSPTGDRIVVGSLDGTARLWDLGDPRSPIAALSHGEAVLSAAFSPDGSKVVTASYDGSARVWAADGTGTPIELHHPAPVVLAAFNPAGDRVVTSSLDSRIRIWATDGSGEPAVLTQPSVPIDVTFSPDGLRLLPVSGDRSARVYAADGLAEAFVLPHGAEVTVGAFSPDGHRAATGSQDGLIRVWSLRPVERQHNSPVKSAVFSPSGSTIASVTSNHIVRAWSAGAFAVPGEIRHKSTVKAVALSADDRFMATASSDGSAGLVPLGMAEPARTLAHPDEVQSVTFSPDAAGLATTCRDGLLRIWPTAGGEPFVLGPPGSYKGQMDVRCVSFSADGRRVLAASGPYVRVWPVEASAEPRLMMARHYGGYIELVDQAFFTPDEQGVIHVVGNVVRVWRTMDAEPVEVRHPTGTSAVAFSADRRWAATASAVDATVIVWNLESLQALPSLEAGGPVRQLVFSPLASRLALLSETTLRVWTLNPRSAVDLHHDGPIVSAAFSPDDERIVTVSEDGSARAWSTGAESRPVVIWHEGPVNGLDFSPDGSHVVTASDDGTTRLWWISGGAVKEQIRAATQQCLRPEFRERYLAIEKMEAVRQFDECEERAGRQIGPNAASEPA